MREAEATTCSDLEMMATLMQEETVALEVGKTKLIIEHTGWLI
jgi:hypothetical protein